LKRLLVKKEQGDVVITSALCIVMVFMFFTILGFNYVTNLAKVSAIENVALVAQSYVLSMETTGGLTQDDRNSLISLLGDSGGLAMQNIDIDTGTSKNDGTNYVAYGKKITLRIRGKLPVYNYSATNSNLSRYVLNKIYVDIDISRMGVSLNL
jgi:hypothetical protein